MAINHLTTLLKVSAPIGYTDAQLLNFLSDLKKANPTDE
jgi:hypothetical protein